MEERNCRNCGAPLDSRGDCEYCGTVKQRTGRSGITLTGTEITMWVDDVMVDRETIADREAGT